MASQFWQQHLHFTRQKKLMRRIKTAQMKRVKRRQWRLPGVFNVKCEHVSHSVLIVDFKTFAGFILKI